MNILFVVNTSGNVLMYFHALVACVKTAVQICMLTILGLSMFILLNNYAQLSVKLEYMYI